MNPGNPPNPNQWGGGGGGEVKKGAFLGIHFVNCGVYGRIYKNNRGDAYIGRCPRCAHVVRVKIGPSGTGTGFSNVFVRIVPSEYHYEICCRNCPGHGIASGKKKDDRFPDGTISMQIPIFKRLGLDLDHFHQGTLIWMCPPFPTNSS